MKRDAKRKGFTLVELLIVIVVIGILSAMMMMSSSEAVSSSRASNITSNMRNLQTAALAYWADNMNKFNKTNPDTPDPAAMKKYLKDDDASEIDDADYTLVVDNGNWFIKYTFNKDKGDDAKVRTKVAGRAASLGLMAGTNDTTVYTNGNDVYLRVR